MEYRTEFCGNIGKDFLEKELILSGWVHTKRDHGGVVFIDLRDYTGIIQVVFGRERIEEDIIEKAKTLRNEDVIRIKGEVRRRPKGTENLKLKTGGFEVWGREIEVLNKSKDIPFLIEDDISVSEEVRMKFRYLDLRRPKMQNAIRNRSLLYKEIRDYFYEKKFVEVETPFLTLSTPEGARDYLVPSRMYPGKFYALPQSPQIFKQILMMGGFDRYFQIVRCFRDEDLRKDRQPEFTQIDLELSFINEEDVMNVVEELVVKLFKRFKGKELKRPFLRLNFDEAISKYGTDKPDLRIPYEIRDVSFIFENTNFSVFKNALSKQGKICALKVDGGSFFSRKNIEELTLFVSEFGAKGLAWIKYNEKWDSSIVKFFSPEELNSLKEELNVENGDIVFFVADKESVVYQSLSNLRIEVAKRMNVIEDAIRPLWIVRPPLLEYNEELKRYQAYHHPFTMPEEENLIFEKDKGKIIARAYDLVINGEEVGGGSIRIHKRELQEEMFRLLNIPEEEYNKRFGFLLEALSYGAPPHGGFAFGLDRLCMILFSIDSIRDVISFPKTQRAICLLTGAPQEVTEKQMEELGIEIREE